MEQQEKKIFHFNFPDTFAEACLIKFFSYLNKRCYLKSDIFIHNIKPNTNFLIFKNIKYNDVFNISKMPLELANSKNVLTLTNDNFIKYTPLYTPALLDFGNKLNSDLNNVMDKIYFQIIGQSKGHTIILNLSYTNFVISELYYIKALAILIKYHEIKDYSKLLIILNCNSTLFTKEARVLFVKNIMSAIKNLKPSNFYNINNFKNKLNDDERDYLNILVNSIGTFDVILDQNKTNTLFRLFNYSSFNSSKKKKRLTIAPEKYFDTCYENFLYI
jgi:hypothetical protein